MFKIKSYSSIEFINYEGELLKTGLFEIYGLQYELVETSWIFDPSFDEPRWYSTDDITSAKWNTFEEVLEDVPKDIKDKLLFNLDLFI